MTFCVTRLFFCNIRKFIVPLFCLFYLFPLSASAETITITADEWCPFNCDPESNHPGYMIEIAKVAFARHNIDIQYVRNPWARAVEEARQGKYTAIVGASINDAPDFIFPETSQGKQQNAFYIQKGNPWKYKDIFSLKTISLGVIAGYSYSAELDAYILMRKNNMKFIQVISGDSAQDVNFKKLILGRIDSYVESETVAQYYLAKNNLQDKVEIAGYLRQSEQDQLYIAFSPQEKKGKEYAAILSQELKSMRASGELEKILSFYNLKDWEKK